MDQNGRQLRLLAGLLQNSTDITGLLAQFQLGDVAAQLFQGRLGADRSSQQNEEKKLTRARKPYAAQSDRLEPANHNCW